ncbi:hypothetical protein DSECCO2_270060 [anaerobic digester metagenome]
MLERPNMAWFSPPILPRWRSGTIMEVAACMAGQWNPDTVARPNMARSTIHTSAVPARNASISNKAMREIRESAAIMVRRRFQRST